MKKNKVHYFTTIAQAILYRSKPIFFVTVFLMIFGILKYLDSLIELDTYEKLDSWYKGLFSEKYIKFLDERFLSFKTLVIGIVSFIVVNFFIGVKYFNRLGKSMVYSLKSSLYRKLIYKIYYEDISIAWKKRISKIIKVFYYHSRETLATQQEVLDKTLDALKVALKEKDKSSRIIWIEGEPFSGKTTTILNLLIDLITQTENQEIFDVLDQKIVYIDLNRDDFILSDFQKDYQSGKYTDFLIIIDNLHRISEKECFNVTEIIIHNLKACAIIFLTRKPENFLYEDRKIQQLYKLMSGCKNKYSLEPIRNRDFVNRKENNLMAFCEKFDKEILNDNSLSVHFSFLHTHIAGKNKKIIDELINFLIVEDEIKDQEFYNFLIVLFSCSIFTGGFHVDTLVNCPSLSLTRKKCQEFLLELYIAGIISMYPDSTGKYFYLHEKISKYYIKQSFSKSSFHQKYLKTFDYLFDYYKKKRNESFAFLYSILLKENVENSHVLFKKIMININFKNLIYEMEFLLSLDKTLEQRYHKELGELYDRTGDFENAEYQFNKCLMNIDVFFNLVQIKHAYYEKYPEIIVQVEEGNNQFYKFLNDYWFLHIEMHAGKFDLDKYANLMDSCMEHCEAIGTHLYDGIHFLRRCYFDYFRSYFLAGQHDPEKFFPYISSSCKIKDFLSDQLEEFPVYYLKFVVTSYFHYEVLFRLFLLNDALSLDNYNKVMDSCDLEMKKLNELSSPMDVVTHTISIYQQIIDKLEQTGDKTSLFVEFHMFELKMLNDEYSTCEIFLSKYSKFADSKTSWIYKEYAATFSLKLKLLQLHSPKTIQYAEDEDLNLYRKNINDLIIKIRNYHSFSPEGNQFASLRLDIYEALFRYSIREEDCEVFKNKMLSLLLFTEQMNYHRENILIRYIQGNNFTLSKGLIFKILKAYPIVTQ